MAQSSENSGVMVRLLGVPEVVGALRKDFPSRGFSLLALLALAPGHRISRKQVADALWESIDSDTNLANLRQLLVRMNRSLPSLDLVLGVDNSTVWLRDDRRMIDLCRLLELRAAPADKCLETAITLYRGGLLDGITGTTEQAGGSLALSRAFVEDRFLSIATECITGIVRYGQADLSLLRAAEFRMLAADPTREQTYRSFIIAYGAVGRPDEARRVYAALAKALRLDGLGLPAQETRLTLARASARVLDGMPDGSREWAQRQTVGLPRLALLAPRWLDGAGSPDVNLHRGLIEDVANELARYRSLVTIAPHSAFLARDDGGLIITNETLRADYSLSSVIDRSADGTSLRVRLVKSQSAAIVWAGKFQLEPQQLIASSRQLIARLAVEVSSAIEGDQFDQLRRTDSAASYLTFLRGQSALKLLDLRSLRRARKEYKAAITEDAGFAEAYSGLSAALFFEWIVLGGNEPRLLADARELAETAIASDPLSAAGHWRQANVLLYQRDFDGSAESFRRAAELHPNSADILLDHSDAMGHVGDANEAWSMFERALELNPTPPERYWWTGAGIAFSQANYQKAIELCDRMLSDEPVLRLLAATHGQLGNLAEAREYGRRVVETYPGQSAEEMSRLQPHRERAHLQPFIDGLRAAGVK